MLLLIDAGNTRIKWAIIDQDSPTSLGAWLHTGSVTHQEFAQNPTLWACYAIQRVIVSNVAGAAIKMQLASALQSRFFEVEWFTSQADLAGITNRYQIPEQLGCDRFASAIGAHVLFPAQALVVATCGTATTIDAVSAQGDFIGGMIAPGLQLMAQSLALNTAQLPHVQDAAAIEINFADHTQAAILSGCVAAQVGAIEHAVTRFSVMTGTIKAEATQTVPLCILSGGAAKFITPSLRVPYRQFDNLVLIGLQAYSSC
jgi:type III pantothenate kinase